MLLLPNKRKIAAVIVSSLGKPSSEGHVQKLGEESGTGGFKGAAPEGDGDVGLEAAMDDLLNAIGQKDARAMARAFKNAMVLCEDDDGGY